MKKILAILMTLILMLTLFAGCAKNAAPKADDSTTKAPVENKLSKDEEAIIADLKKEFNMDNYEEFVAAGLKADEEFVQIAQEAGLDIDEYVNAFATKYKWDIGDVSVDGDKAIAKITMTCPDFEKMDVIFDEKLDEYMANNDTSKLTESEAQKLVCDIMMDILKSEDLPLTSEDFDIDYIKEDGAWKMAETEEVEKAMVAAQGLDAAA